MLDINAVKGFFTYDLPEAFLPLAETFDGDATKPLVSDEEFAAVENATGVDHACFEFLKEMNAKLLADTERNLAARFLRYCLFEARKPWENEIRPPAWICCSSPPLWAIP